MDQWHGVGKESSDLPSQNKEERRYAACRMHFSNVEYDDFRIGVPYPGKYKEMFNSDAESYGGTGVGNPRVKMSKKTECDERKNSITVKLAPLLFRYFLYEAGDGRCKQ